MTPPPPVRGMITKYYLIRSFCMLKGSHSQKEMQLLAPAVEKCPEKRIQIHVLNLVGTKGQR